MKIAHILAFAFVTILFLNAISFWHTSDAQKPLLTAIEKQQKAHPETPPQFVAGKETQELFALRYMESFKYASIFFGVVLSANTIWLYRRRKRANSPTAQ